MNILAVMIGGALGSLSRYGLGLLANQPGIPMGTWIANVTGSFLIGLFFVWGKEKGLLSDTTYLLLTTGLLGGFTTFSSFSLEVITMALQGQWAKAGFYVLASMGVGLFAAYVGVKLGRIWFV